MLKSSWPANVSSDDEPVARGGTSFVKLENDAAPSSSQRRLKNTPSRPPAPHPLFTCHASSACVYWPNPPSSTFPPLCAAAVAADVTTAIAPAKSVTNRRCPLISPPRIGRRLARPLTLRALAII